MEPLGTSYYIAPEVLDTCYDSKCDIWSIGVIMFMLLTGKPPFNGQNDKQIIKSVRAGEYDKELLEGKSEAACDLIKGLLTYDPQRRLTADEAINHPWIKMHVKHTKGDQNATIAALANLSQFNTR